MGSVCIKRSILELPANFNQSVLSPKDETGDDAYTNCSQSPSSLQRVQFSACPVKHRHTRIDSRLHCGPTSELSGATLSKHVMSPAEEKLVRGCLDQHFLLGRVSATAKTTLLQQFKLYKVKAQQRVFSQNEPGKCFYVINAGQVEVLVNDHMRGTLGTGQSFGELALIDNSLRTASIITVDKCSFWVLEGTTFRSVLKTVSEARVKETMHFIRSVPLFNDLTNSQQTSLAQSLTTEIWSSGQTIVSEGDPGDLFYIVEKGQVACSEQGKELRKLSSGHYFGELALLHSAPRSATVTSVTPVTLLSIGRSTLIEVLGGSLEQVIYTNLLRIILETSPILRFLSTEQTEAVLEEMRVVVCQAEEVVASQGSRQNAAVYMVLRGALMCGDKLYEARSCVSDTCLFSDSVYPEDLIAVEETHLGILTKERLEATVGSSLDELLAFHEEFSLFKQAPLFCNLPTSKLQRLFRLTVTVDFTDGETLVTEGSRDERFYIVKAGTVEIRKDNAVLRRVSRLDYFGEHAVLLGNMQPADVVSVGKTACWVLHKTAFHSVVDTGVIQQLLKRIDVQDDTVQLSDLLPVKALSKGSFGRVYLTVHKEKKTLYALKTVTRAKIAQHELYSEMTQERQTLLQLEHFLVTKLVKTFKDNQRLYFLLEYVRGLDLLQVLQHLGALPEATARFYTGSLVLVVEYLHSQNIVFRDLQPENLMVDDEGYLKLIDFGTAKAVRGRTYTAVGTPHYLAPEVILGTGYSAAVDWWSVGVMLFEFLFGYLPFGDTEDCPEAIYKAVLQYQVKYPAMAVCSAQPLIQQLLSKNPEARTGGSVSKLKQHRWFGVFNWEELSAKRMPAPFLPTGGSLDDTVKKALHMRKDLQEFLVKSEKKVKPLFNSPPVDWDADF